MLIFRQKYFQFCTPRLTTGTTITYTDNVLNMALMVFNHLQDRKAGPYGKFEFEKVTLLH